VEKRRFQGIVEAVERHIENGLAPKAAAFKAMEEISGPVIGIKTRILGGKTTVSGHERAGV